MTNRLLIPEIHKVDDAENISSKYHASGLRKWTGIDLFCGAGGTTIGVVESEVAGIVAAINHDPVAIASHAANHPQTQHYTEDIVDFDVSSLPTKVNFIWMSAECTHFSNAKGGQSRDADSRTLSEQIYRYASWCNPDYILVENVREWLSYGPLIQKRDKSGKVILKDGKPIMVPQVDGNKQGPYYNRWVATLKNMGWVSHRYKLLNSADYGSYTSRTRYFGIFAKSGLPIRFPSPTHHKKGLMGLEKWKAVKAVLDFEDEGKSIFGRKKALSEKTLARIYAGLLKYVVPFLSTEESNHQDCNKDGLNKAFLTQRYSGDNRNTDLFSPCPTITTRDHNELVQVSTSFLSKYYSGRPEHKNISTDGPAGTITTVDSQALIQTYFLQKYHGTGENVLSVECPASSLTTRDRLALVEATGSSHNFIMKQYNAPNNNSSINSPAGSITCNPKMVLVGVKPFLMRTQFNNQPTDLEGPAPTLVASRRHHYLVNPQYHSKGHSVENPCPTLIAIMDKRPISLVSVVSGVSPAEKQESEFSRKIKDFMRQYGIEDIKMRMLKVSELKLIQGFPADYVLKGTQTDQKKFIGNSVEPRMAKNIIRTLYMACQEFAIA